MRSTLSQCIMPNAPTSALAVLTKLLMDQGLMAPFGTVLFFTTMKVRLQRRRARMTWALGLVKQPSCFNQCSVSSFNDWSKYFHASAAVCTQLHASVESSLFSNRKSFPYVCSASPPLVCVCRCWRDSLDWLCMR